jgi:protoporphyrinogen/coproporphyrinogen III oxidase
MTMRIAVVGAGIGGLTLAFHLRKKAEVVVFEKSQRPGGNIQTEDIAGCRLEWGPLGFLNNEPATLELVAELGLEDRLLPARPDAARFIYRAGKVREMYGNPVRFLLSGCLPVAARLRLLLEPFSRLPPEGDESVYDFAARHLGHGAAKVLVDAMVTGIFAGDPKRLSLKSALPKLDALQQKSRSLVIAAQGKGFGPRGHLHSFDQGFEVLPQRLAETVQVEYGADLKALPTGFDHVVCALPAPRAADLIEASELERKTELAAALRKIRLAPVGVVGLVFDDASWEGHPPPEGFGFLVPRGQGMRILGSTYDSSSFTGRAPAGQRLYRVLVGGRRDPEALDLDDAALLELIHRELTQAWGFCPRPAAHKIIRHRLGIPQYEVGHQAILDEIDRLAPPTLSFTGNSFHGIAVNACIADAKALAGRLAGG